MKHKLAIILFTAVLTSGVTSCASSSPGAKKYPLTTCIVTGNDLGSMGTPVTTVHQGREIKFCCKSCVAKFDANPGKYLAKLP
ncbi:MAG: hypothetical protein K1X78_04615 [Verrucomicrobiaceae bacterium]|nr:hypothetical protein [Verrucomicrobiaceae bacterium]